MSPELAANLIADRYRVIRPLGSGGMATVVLAEDELLRRRVAVKLLHPDGDESMARRLLREAKIGASLNHPSLVVVFDTLLHGSELVVVMEYVEGETLARALDAGPVELGRGLEILRAVAAGLDHAHDRGIVHRDVKPGNILLGRSGVVKLSDLGIAYSADASRITRTGTALGSVAYMSPEQLEGHPATPPTDVYSLAAVAFELLGNRRAHPGTTPMAIMDQVAAESPPDLREAWPQAPAEVARLLKRAMARDPALRPARAEAFVDDLSSAMHKSAAPEPAADLTAAFAPMVARVPEPAVRRVTPSPSPSPSRADGSPRRAAILVSLLALVLVAGGLVSLLRDDGPAPGDNGAPAPQAQAPGQPDGRGSGAGAAGGTPTASGAQDAPAGSGAVAGASDTGGPGTGADAESVKDPVGAVRAFYGRATRQDAVGACALRGPRLQSRFECAELTGQFKTLRSVAFDSIAVQAQTSQAATVALITTAKHVEHTDRCRGTIDLVRDAADDWLLDRLGVACTRT